MRNIPLIWIAVIAVLVVGGFLLLGNRQQATQPGGEGMGGGPGFLPDSKKMEVQLNPVNKDEIDQSGRAIFEEKDGKVTVTLNVNRVEGLNNQPAHIHAGACPGVGEILFPLNNVVDGRSITEIETTIDQLRDDQNPMALNIHKSAEESSIYTACGNLGL